METEAAPVRRWDPNVPPAYCAEPPLLLRRATQALRRAVLTTSAHARFGALLAGPTGAGKSSVAAWLVRRWKASKWDKDAHDWKREPSIAWLDALEATDAERRYRLGTGNPAELDRAFEADWLVIDDVGKSSSVSLVQLILARRYQDALPTIVTTGLTPAEFSAHVGAATVRRIVEWEGQAGLFVDAHNEAPTTGARGQAA